MPCNSNLCGFQAFLHPFQSICDKSLVLPTLFHPPRFFALAPRVRRYASAIAARNPFGESTILLHSRKVGTLAVPTHASDEISRNPNPRFRQSHLTAHSRAHRRRDTHNAIWLAFRGCKLARHSHTYGMAPPPSWQVFAALHWSCTHRPSLLARRNVVGIHTAQSDNDNGYITGAFKALWRSWNVARRDPSRSSITQGTHVAYWIVSRTLFSRVACLA